MCLYFEYENIHKKISCLKNYFFNYKFILPIGIYLFNNEYLSMKK